MEILSVLGKLNIRTLVHSQKVSLLIGDNVTGLMEDMVSEINFENWMVFRYREEGVIIIPPVYRGEYTHVTTAPITTYNMFITLGSFPAPQPSHAHDPSLQAAPHTILLQLLPLTQRLPESQLLLIHKLTHLAQCQPRLFPGTSA